MRVTKQFHNTEIQPPAKINDNIVTRIKEKIEEVFSTFSEAVSISLNLCKKH